MNCNDSKHLIDLRVHAAAEAADPAQDWSVLDVHLSACPSCAADYRELLRTRELLARISNDQPTNQEIDSMMAALAVSGPSSTQVVSRRSWSRLRFQVFAALATAAVLGLAFQLGSMRFEGGVRNPLSAVRNAFVGAYEWGDKSGIFSNVDTSLPTASAEADPRTDINRESPAVRRSVSVEKTKVSKKMSPPNENIAGAVVGAPDLVGLKIGATINQPLPESGEKQVPASPPPPAPSILAGPTNSLGDRWHGTLEFADQLQEAPVAAFGTFRVDLDDEESPAGQQQARQLLQRMTPPSIGRSDPSVQLQQRQQRSHSGGGGQGVFSGGGQGAETPSTPPAPRSSSKIIKTGELALEVHSYETAVTRLETIVSESAAVIADAITQEQPGGALTGRIVIRCPPEAFEGLFAALKQIGRVESENAKAADVTAEYVDLEARIHGLQITEERLHDLVKNKSIVDKVSALLEVERELTRVRSQIEQLQGQLRVMADRVALSTISVTLREPGRTVPSAVLDVEVPVLHEAVEALGKSLEALGGRLVTGDTTSQSTGRLLGTYQLQVSLRNFAALQSAIENLGHVEKQQTKDRDFGTQPVADRANITAPNQTAAAQPAPDDLDRVKCSINLSLWERSRQLPNAQLRVEVDNVDATMKSLTRVLADTNGALISNRTTRQNDGTNVAELKLRVSAVKFADLLDAIVPLGRTTEKRVNGETGGIFGGAASSPCELTLTLAERPREVPSGTVSIEVAQFTSARDALSKLVAEKNVQVLASASSQRPDGTWVGQFRLGIKSADMEAVVSTLERLGRVTGRQLNGLGLGDLSRIAPDTVGSVALTLAEPSAINPSPDQAGGTLRGRLRAALEALYDSLGLIVYGLIVLAPWLIVIVLIAWLIARVRRARNPVVAATSNS